MDNQHLINLCRGSISRQPDPNGGTGTALVVLAAQPIRKARSLYFATGRMSRVSLPVGLAENDVEGAGESTRLHGWPKRHNKSRAGGGITHARQYPVTLVLRLARDVHLRDET